eukprot:TRINITY_DN15821_c0_g1_i1.p1 TRINITY_DN15821_c0_g1~~TRINITY_DN15821_c0_g1_i1.p1  ORF type:complete len:247 (+),score=79.83 TRINITY_DN15821_c0_g1_i1:48-743(+)
MSETVWKEEYVETEEGEVIQVKVGVPEVVREDVLVVVTHPYGLLGGDLDNPVCMAVGRMAVEKGLVTVRLNFRGVGESSGTGSWRGQAEQQDVLSVISRYETHPAFTSPPRIALIGYSYGSLISGSLLSRHPSIALYTAIAYPFSVAWALTLFNQEAYLRPLQESPSIPKLFIHGNRDQFTSTDAAAAKVKTMGDSASISTLQYADHFFGARKTKIVVERISAFLDDNLKM